MCWVRILSGTADPTKRRVIRDIIVKLIYLVLLLPKKSSNKLIVCFFFSCKLKFKCRSSCSDTILCICQLQYIQLVESNFTRKLFFLPFVAQFYYATMNLLFSHVNNLNRHKSQNTHVNINTKNLTFSHNDKIQQQRYNQNWLHTRRW